MFYVICDLEIFNFSYFFSIYTLGAISLTNLIQENYYIFLKGKRASLPPSKGVTERENRPSYIDIKL